MDVQLLNCDINIQELFDKVSKCGSGSVSLFVGTSKDISEKSALGTVTGESRNEVIQSYLLDICREVSRKFSVIHIAIQCWLDASNDAPCLAIACLASTYENASEAVNNAIDIINGKPKFGCDELEETSDDVVPIDLIQVKAGLQEINQRINSFIERRRAQVNCDNVRDFCCARLPSEGSCARVDAVKIHRKDSHSHLRVRKVVNTWGPQTISSYSDNKRVILSNSPELVCHTGKAKAKVEEKELDEYSKNAAFKRVILDERLKNIEEHVGFSNDSTIDVNARLKKIEDKILYLEGLSPEYFDLWRDKSKEVSNSTENKNIRKRTYSTVEISNKIKELEYHSID